ncbi:MAG: PLP-dependent transferase [Phycisphaerales bacterium]|nr:PLP-dependent transferase [Phycisphaerales bacterium]
MSRLPRRLPTSKSFEARSAAAHRAEPSRTVRNRGLAANAGIDTVAIRGGRRPDPTTGAILTPIYQTTTYAQDAVGVHKGHTYSRASNPTVSALEDALGALENTPPAVCFSTGLAAITTLFLALLKAGDHVVVSDVVYGGTVRLLNLVLEPLGITASFVDTSDVNAVEDAITSRTRLVFVETPANPTLKLVDVEAIARITKKLGIPLAVDNTFLTPVLFRPLDLGGDITVYSTTKYIEGHNATVGGSISTRDAKLLDRLRLFRKSLGSIQAPFDAWLTLKGLKTLPLRIRQHSRSALEVARFLESHPKVAKVFYPGLSEFPQAELALRQNRSQLGTKIEGKRSLKNADSETFFGGIVAFEVAGGVDSGVTVMNNVQLCTLAENLGATETLITHPVSMTHGDVPREQRERTGITDGLIRLSVGLEDPADIIADLEQALDQVVVQATPRSARITRTTRTTIKTRGRARQLA